MDAASFRANSYYFGTELILGTNPPTQGFFNTNTPWQMPFIFVSCTRVYYAANIISLH